MRKIFLVLLILFLFLSPLVPVAGAPAEPKIFEIPKDVRVFHISKDGVLGIKTIETGYMSFKNQLLFAKDLESEFIPIDVFEDIEPVLNEVIPSGDYPVVVSAKLKGENKYSVYIINGRGEIINKVPNSESLSPISPFFDPNSHMQVTQDLLNPTRYYIIPSAYTQYGYKLNLQKITLVEDGGKSFKEISLPGTTPDDIEGIIFNPNNIKEMWAWRSSMGYWTGVKHSKDGGITWQFVEHCPESFFYRFAYNPITKEVVMLTKMPLSIVTDKGKVYDFKGTTVAELPYYIHPYILALFFSKKTKGIIIPITRGLDSKRTIGEIYSYSNGNCEHIADIPAIEGDPVYGGFISDDAFFLSFSSHDKNKVLVYTLNVASPAKRLNILLIIFLFLFIFCIFVFYKHLSIILIIVKTKDRIVHLIKNILNKLSKSH